MTVIHLTDPLSEWADITRYARILARADIASGLDADLVALPGGFLSGILAPVRLARRLRAAGDDVTVHAHSPAAASVALRARQLDGCDHVRVVASVHEFPASPSLADIAALRQCTAVSASSPDVVGRLAAAGIPARLVTPTVPSPRVIPPLPETPVYIHHGHLTRANGIDRVITTFLDIAADPAARLIIVGEGPGRDVMPQIRRVRSARLTDRVEWAGPADLGACMARARFGLYPAVAPGRFRLAPLESQAMGRRVADTPGE